MSKIDKSEDTRRELRRRKRGDQLKQDISYDESIFVKSLIGCLQALQVAQTNYSRLKNTFKGSVYKKQAALDQALRMLKKAEKGLLSSEAQFLQDRREVEEVKEIIDTLSYVNEKLSLLERNLVKSRERAPSSYLRECTDILKQAIKYSRSG